MIGETIGRYRVVEKLGQGGMGVVYKARDTLLGRFVALKALPPESVADPQRRQRFLDEAKAASALQHPGIVSVYDVVEAGDQVFIVMEHVSGETLEQRMGQRALPLSRGLRYAEQIADALARAHAAGIVHRDLKPSNVMVTEDDAAKVLDFGLAKLAEAPYPEDAPTVEPACRAPDPRGRGRGHARLHVPGAGGREGGRRADRRLLLRRAALPDAHGPPPLPARLAAQRRSRPSARESPRPRPRWLPACLPRPSAPSSAACTRSPRDAGRAWPTSRPSSATCARTPNPGARKASPRWRREGHGRGGGRRPPRRSSSRRRRGSVSTDGPPGTRRRVPSG